MTKTLQLTNTETGQKAPFVPETPDRVTMYVCGPTVYDRAHIGNARSAVVFDLLFRLLRHIYGESHVVYARNFTDVDDKIIAGAQTRFPDLSIDSAITRLTEETIDWYHQDMGALGVLTPTHEPRATEYVREMVEDIRQLVLGGQAYTRDRHVFFAVDRSAHRGTLSGRRDLSDETLHRVDPNPLKDHPADFVLWKPSEPNQPKWPSHWGGGRPGWHIECSTMSNRLLGESFDIHGGGADLTFPHHDNEIVQAKGLHPHAHYARIWLHNGMITVAGQKMSKSLGNFITVETLRRRLPGGAIRLALLAAHYRANLDWTEELEATALKTWTNFAGLARRGNPDADVPEAVTDLLFDDMNTGGLLAVLHDLAEAQDADGMAASLALLGVPLEDDRTGLTETVKARVEALLSERRSARAAKDYARSDAIRDLLGAAGVIVEDGKEGTTWSPGPAFDPGGLSE